MRKESFFFWNGTWVGTQATWNRGPGRLAKNGIPRTNAWVFPTVFVEYFPIKIISCREIKSLLPIRDIATVVAAGQPKDVSHEGGYN